MQDERATVKRAANFVPMTPLDFLRRSGDVMADKIGIVDRDRHWSYATFRARAEALAGALRQAGIERGRTVAALLPNIAELLEAHFGVPLSGGVLNALNIRLDAGSIGTILDHSEARILVVHRNFLAVAEAALGAMQSRPALVTVGATAEERARLGASDYEDFLDGHTSGWSEPGDEWDSIALNYTSGTTGQPKCVVYSHRGAYLNALGNVITLGLKPESVYLWTLPMFHCNGWTHPWAVTAVGARHVCLPQIDSREIFRLIAEEGVTHFSAAPVVLTMLIHAPDSHKIRFSHGPVDIATGGAAPPGATLAAMERMGFRLTHLYGMTESYGPAISCLPQEDWAGLDLEARAVRMARQGVRNPTVSDHGVLDPDTGLPVPRDGATLGELVLRGNSVMKGYGGCAEATAEALRDGWLHTGDLAVVHPDGYVEIKDRSKDIIISGGENISSLEVESVLYRHPAVQEAAVVARPDDKWGETPCAFVTLKAGSGGITEGDIVAFCRAQLAGFKVPRTIVFGPLPKTGTGKIVKHELRDAAARLG
jgi:fatty-acyl-CoA synthase